MIDASVFNSHSITDSSFPYNVWQQQATVWSRQYQRCRCHLAWDRSLCRTYSNPAEAGSSSSLARHAPARIWYCSLRSWVWWCKVPATQLHHRKLFAKPAKLQITLMWSQFTIYYSGCILTARSELCFFKKFFKCIYMTKFMWLLTLYRIYYFNILIC